MPDYVRWLRSRIGHRKVILAYATALIRDDAAQRHGGGRLLFQRRTDFGDAWWGLPGGVLEIGETFEDCVVRETLEETGWRVEPTRLVGIYTSPDYDVRYPNGDEVQQFTAAFECRLLGERSRIDGGQSTSDPLYSDPPNGVEISEHRFFALNDLPPMPRWYSAMVNDLRGQVGPTFDPPQSGAVTVDGWRSLRQRVGPGRMIVAGAAALIRDGAGRILLGLRREGVWGLPAGLMELGESISGTMVREAREEMDVEFAPRELLGVFTGPRFFHTYADGNQVQIISTFFRADIVSGELKADGVETLDLRWFDPTALPEAMPARHRWLLEYALTKQEE